MGLCCGYALYFVVVQTLLKNYSIIYELIFLHDMRMQTEYLQNSTTVLYIPSDEGSTVVESGVCTLQLEHMRGGKAFEKGTEQFNEISMKFLPLFVLILQNILQ